MLAKSIKNNNEWGDPKAQNTLQNEDNEKDGSRLLADGRGKQKRYESHDIVSGDQRDTNSNEGIINQRLKRCISLHHEITR